MKHFSPIYLVIAILLIAAEIPFAYYYYTDTQTDHNNREPYKGALTQMRGIFNASHISTLRTFPILSDPRNETFSKAKAFFEEHADKPFFQTFDGFSDMILIPIRMEGWCLPCHGSPGDTSLKSVENTERQFGFKPGDLGGVLYLRLSRIDPFSFEYIAAHVVLLILGLALLITILLKSRTHALEQVLKQAKEQARTLVQALGQAHSQTLEKTMKLVESQTQALKQKMEHEIEQAKRQVEEKEEEKAKKCRVLIYTFDDFSLFVDGKKVKVSKGFNLIKFLIAHRENGVDIQKIGDVLWPDTDGDRIKPYIDQTIKRMVKPFIKDFQAPDMIINDDGQIRLNTDFCFVDAFVVEQLIKEFSKEKIPEKKETIKNKILELYKGLFLPYDEIDPSFPSYRNWFEDSLKRYKIIEGSE